MTSTVAAPVSPIATFVEQLYAQFLYREADAASLAHWVAQIDGGHINAAELSAAFIASAEFQQVVDPVVRLYFTAFGRIPDAAGVAYWAEAGLTPLALGANFASSAEFQKLYIDVSDSAFLDTLYLNAFKRAPDAAGKAYFMEQLATGASRTEIVVAFSTSDEMHDAMGATVSVVEQFLGVHGVAPTAAQVAAALATVDPVALITKLYASEQYAGADVPFLTTAGVVVDGYIKGATVTMTFSEMVDGVATTRTATRVTDDKGAFDFGDQAGFGSMVQTGGIDIATGAKVNGSFSAAAGSSVINPLTTLVQAIVAGGAHSAADAEALVKARLGIDAALDLGNFDPVAALGVAGISAAAQASALKVVAALAQVNTIMGQVGAVLSGAGVSGVDAGANAAVKALADLIAGSSAALDLGAAATGTQLLTDAAAAAGASAAQAAAVAALGADAGTVIANLNDAIAAAAGSSSGDAQAHLIALAQVQVAAEKIETGMASGAQAGNLGASAAATGTAALTAAINAAANAVGDVNGDGRGDAPTAPNPTPTPTPTPATFIVNYNALSATVSFGGSANGDIKFTVVDDVAIFSRDGIVKTANPVDMSQTVTITLSSTEILIGSTVQFTDAMLDNVQVSGGTVVLYVPDGELAGDWANFSQTALNFIISGAVSVANDANLGGAWIEVIANASLSIDAARVSERTVTGGGSLTVTDFDGFADLSNVASAGLIVSTVDQPGVDISGNDTLGNVTEYVLNDLLTLTAGQASSVTFSDAGNGNSHVDIAGSEGNQIIDLSTLLNGGNKVEGGQGADIIKLAGGGNLVYTTLGGPATPQKDTVELTGTYEAGDVISLEVDENGVSYVVLDADLTGGGSALAAIGAKLAAAVNANYVGEIVSATADNDGVVTLAGRDVSAAFSVQNVAARNGSAVQQKDTITLSGSYEAGDTITVTSSYGDHGVTYTVTAEDLTANGAESSFALQRENIAEQLTAALDNAGMQVGVSGAVIRVTTGGATTITVSADNAAPVDAVAQVSTLTLAGTYEVGDKVTVSVAGVSVTYTTVAGDLTGTVLDNVAAGLALALDDDIGGDYTIVANDAEITITSNNPGVAFSITSDTENAAGQEQIDALTLQDVYHADDVIEVYFGLSEAAYTVTPSDAEAGIDFITEIVAGLIAGLDPALSTSTEGAVITIVNSASAVAVGATSIIDGASVAGVIVNVQAYSAGGDPSQGVSAPDTTAAAPAQGIDDSQNATQATTLAYVAGGSDLTQSAAHGGTVPAVGAGHSNLAEMDVVHGFIPGEDQLMLVSNTGHFFDVYGLERFSDIASSNDLSATLEATFGNLASAEGGVVVIEAGSAAGTYLYVNDGDDDYSASADMFIELVGVDGLGAVGELNTFDFFGSST